ncbi:hypothetical protein [Sphingomicrobium sediminis]|uniref:Uncharacterized protein n=1 Tax=Sphingomicrobium sediminis TaxID=2950949 RepID=A0A9X2J5L2_9SPHN|nr:hypothetical protein [Sphingomicrobium sediminis]MCM8558357.1 hypothetical protein [Sphingomicrobium sediminis]
MQIALAIIVALLAPPLIALRWDGHKLARLRERAKATGLDAEPASTAAYLMRGLPAFALASIGICAAVLVEQMFDVERLIGIAVFGPFAVAAILLQHRVVRGIERDLFG